LLELNAGQLFAPHKIISPLGGQIVYEHDEADGQT